VYAAVFTHDASLTRNAAMLAALVAAMVAALVVAMVAPMTMR
jgi:hypothetical protein